MHPLVRANIEAVAALGRLRVPGMFSQGCLDDDCCSDSGSRPHGPLPRGVASCRCTRAATASWAGAPAWTPPPKHVEVRSSHCGMAVHAGAYRAVADALAAFRRRDARRKPLAAVATARRRVAAVPSTPSATIHAMVSRPTLGSTASLGFRVARGLYGRWRRMNAPERPGSRAGRRRQGAGAGAARARPTPTAPDAISSRPSERLADAMVESADADPEVSDAEVEELRGDLARELERLATGEVSASRSRAQSKVKR